MSFKNKFGRILSHDERDKGYLMAGRLAAPGLALPISKVWRIGYHNIDQVGGVCVGCSWSNFLRCQPNQMIEGYDQRAYEIYDKAIQIDEWPENDNGDREWGTSVRAGAEVVLAMGKLKSYLWAFTLQPALEWVLTQGPVVLGTDWPTSFMRPNKEGIVKITPATTSAGGHAYLWRGVNTRRGLALISNSWGEGWGRGGECFIPLRDLETLIVNGGECATATKQKLQALDPPTLQPG